MKAVLFDFDGVLTTDKTGSLTTLRALGEATGIPLTRLRDAFAPYNDALNLGRTTHAAIWPAVCRALNARIDARLLQAAFESTPFNARMLALARDLRRTCAVGIVTDNKKDRMDHLTTYAGLSSLFDPIVVSAAIGADKSSPAIFERALDHLGIAPADAVFIDNSERNLVAPRGMGMAAVHFDDDLNDVEGLATLLRERYGLAIAHDVFASGGRHEP